MWPHRPRMIASIFTIYHPRHTTVGVPAIVAGCENEVADVVSWLNSGRPDRPSAVNESEGERKKLLSRSSAVDVEMMS